MFYAVSEDQQEAFVTAYVRTAAWANGLTVETLDEVAEQELRVEAQTATDTDEHLVRLIQCAEKRSKVGGPHYARRYSWEQAGHDFYLTRERHGAGFWDRGLGMVGDALTEVAHAWGSSDVLLPDPDEHLFNA